MNDLEICKLIAEIEGVDYEVNHWGDVVSTNVGLRKLYNPLTDKALCFELIEKWVEEFGIDIHRAYKEHHCTYAVDTGFSVIFNDSLAKAACLARIAISKRGGRT